MTTLGLLSDTHGHAEIANQAVRLLVQHGADILIHLGDVGTAQVIDALAVSRPGSGGEQIESHLVFGNCDWEVKALTRYANDLGVIPHDPAGELIIDGKRIVFTHGHLPAVMDQAIRGQADYLLHGHTHRQSDERVAKTRVINPGALFRANKHTVALLTLSTDALEVFEVTGLAGES